MRYMTIFDVFDVLISMLWYTETAYKIYKTRASFTNREINKVTMQCGKHVHKIKGCNHSSMPFNFNSGCDYFCWKHGVLVKPPLKLVNMNGY